MITWYYLGVSLEDVRAKACTVDCAHYRAGTCPFVWPDLTCPRMAHMAAVLSDLKESTL